jgi:hypothetical protein
MLRFSWMRPLEKVVAVHASFHNQFNAERDLSRRSNFKLIAPPFLLSGAISAQSNRLRLLEN